MRVWQSWLVLGMLLIPAAVGADDHRADVFAAFSYARGSTLLGLHEAYALGLPKPINKDFSIVLGDLSVQFGSEGGNDVTQVAFLGGPRWTIAQPDQEFKPSVHVLAGGVYTNAGAVSGTDFAVAFGAGFEYLPTDPDTKLLKPWGVRAQVDYVLRGGDRDNFPRLSVGVLYRFKK